MTKRLLLAGGGHGHVYVVKRLVHEMPDDLEVVMISDAPNHLYSGMIAGYLEDIYSLDDVTHKVEEICQKAGVRFIEDRITAINHNKKTVYGQKDQYTYDYLGLDLGSAGIKHPNFTGSAIHYVKPASNLVTLKQKLIQENYPRIAIVGAGASGVEITFAIRQNNPEAQIILLNAKENPVDNFNPKSQALVFKAFDKQAIEYHGQTKVQQIQDQTIETDQGQFQADLIICALGVTGVDVDFTGFETDDKNYLKASTQLQVAKDAFALGDMIYIEEFPYITKAGVYAVRESPIYYHNLMATIKGEANLRDFEAPREYLAILNTGNRTAISDHKNKTRSGRLQFELKNWIDKHFMRRSYRFRRESII